MLINAGALILQIKHRPSVISDHPKFNVYWKLGILSLIYDMHEHTLNFLGSLKNNTLKTQSNKDPSKYQTDCHLTYDKVFFSVNG